MKVQGLSIGIALLFL